MAEWRMLIKYIWTWTNKFLFFPIIWDPLVVPYSFSVNYTSNVAILLEETILFSETNLES